MTTTDLVPAPRSPEQLELDRLARLGTWLAALESGGDDPTSRGAAAALRFYYAEQLELPPTAVTEITVIHGRLFIGAQLLRALAERAGYKVARPESTAETCTATLIDKATGEELGRTTFTIEDARAAGLIRDRSGWKSHPARMLWARASTLVVRDFAPQISLGMYSRDLGEQTTGIAYDEDPPAAYDEDPTIPFGDSYDEPGVDMGQSVEAEIVEELQGMAE